jgi:DNA-binding transcriptional regulator YhcF (GntR family)
MKFEFDNERPIYIQIVEKLRITIVSGYYPPGSKIPSVRDLALSAKVNPNTMQKALTELEDDKLIYTERTNGKYVTEDKKLLERVKKELSKDIINKYVRDMESIGISYEESINYLKELGE